MDKALKEKWIAALRSVEFDQTTGKFERDGRYCCLGVLCVVTGAPTSNPQCEGFGNWDHVEKLLGDYPTARDLASMNDSGKSFPEMADFIEEHL